MFCLLNFISFGQLTLKCVQEDDFKYNNIVINCTYPSLYHEDISQILKLSIFAVNILIPK